MLYRLNLMNDTERISDEEGIEFDCDDQACVVMLQAIRDFFEDQAAGWHAWADWKAELVDACGRVLITVPFDVSHTHAFVRAQHAPSPAAADGQRWHVDQKLSEIMRRAGESFRTRTIALSRPFAGCSPVPLGYADQIEVIGADGEVCNMAQRSRAGARIVPIEPSPVDVLRPKPEERFLLWCPEQGGWLTGEWYDGKWFDALHIEVELFPTHALPLPFDPDTCGTAH